MDKVGNEDTSAATRSWNVDPIATVVSVATSEDALGTTPRDTDSTITFSEGLNPSTLRSATTTS